MMLRKDSPQGTDNVLVDLGFDDAEELSAKTILAIKLNEVSLDQHVEIIVRPAQHAYAAGITVAA